MVPLPPDLNLKELFDRYDRGFHMQLCAIYQSTKYSDSPWALKNEIACHLSSLRFAAHDGNFDAMVEFVRDAPAWLDECSVYLRDNLI